MGGILSGVFTPTESAAVACIWAFLVTVFVYRDYKIRELPHLIGRVVRTVGMVMIMIGFLSRVRLHDDADADSGHNRGVLHLDRKRQVYVSCSM